MAQVLTQPAEKLVHRLALGDLITRNTASRSDVMAMAAAVICSSGADYRHLGRGPAFYDEVGLVRACAQAAVDWACDSVGAAAPILADYDRYPEEQGKADANDLDQLFRSWGMQRAAAARHLNVNKEARRGDVFTYLGRGPCMGVVVEPWRETAAGGFDAPAVALAWAGRPPRVERLSRMSWFALSLYRWPAPIGGLVEETDAIGGAQ